MSSTNRGSSRSARDFYRTPAWCVDAIMSELPAGGSVLEPCAGDGAIVRALAANGVHPDTVDAIEIDEAHGRALNKTGADVIIGDALSDLDAHATGMWRSPHGLVIMNPPFLVAQKFCERAISMCRLHRGTTASLMRLAMLESRERVRFWQENPADVFVLSRRPSFSTNGKTDSAAYAWFVWGPGRGGRWSLLPCERRGAS